MHPICFRFEYIMVENFEGESEPLFYNYLRPLTSLDEGLYALACEEDVRCLATLVRSFKLIEVYIEHGVMALDCYIRPQREPTKEPVCDSVTPSSLPQHASSTPCKVPVCDSITPRCMPDCFADVTESGVESSGLSHDESFGVDDLDLNLNEPVNTQEHIVAEVSEVGTHEFTVEDVILEDYVSSGEDVEQGIDTAYETEYDVQSSEDSCTNDDDDDDFLVNEENEIIEPDVDVHLFCISMDLPFDNISVTNLVPGDVLEGEDVDVINVDGFDSDPGNDDETNDYRRRRLAKLSRETKGVINASGQWKNLKLYKNDSVRIRTRCDGKVPVFTMSQGTGPTGQNRGMKAGPSRSSVPTTRSKKRKNTCTNDDSQASSSIFNAHDKGDLCPWVLDYVVELQSTNPNTTVKITVERNTDPSLPTRVFQRIYVCLGALKLGFKACRRDMLGLDGTLMKGPFLGQCLGDDIDLHPNSNYTFISDRQKGIVPAIKTVFPNAEHIYCLRHIHENMKQGWCGQAYKDLLWRADLLQVLRKASSSASRQAQQTEHAVVQDGLGGSGAGAVIGLSVAAGQGGASGLGGAAWGSLPRSDLFKVAMLDPSPNLLVHGERLEIRDYLGCAIWKNLGYSEWSTPAGLKLARENLQSRVKEEDSIN
ncbi:putative transposase, mutator type, MULE transposase domain protein [Tanacetum coccineum]